MTQAKPIVMIATPCYSGHVAIEYLNSIAKTVHLLGEHRISHAITILQGDPFIGKARSRLASQFLTDYPTFTDLFFIDDDIGFPAEKVIRFLFHKEDVLVGACPKRSHTREWAADFFLRDGKILRKKNGLIMAGNITPTGFMRVKRHVIERMAEGCPWHLQHAEGTIRKVWHLFYAGHTDPAIEKLRTTDLSQFTREEMMAWLQRAIGVAPHTEEGKFWGEDSHFGNRWREMGGEVWVDPDISFTHRGPRVWGDGMTFADAIALEGVPVQLVDG
jgi:hypothetical protein